MKTLTPKVHRLGERLVLQLHTVLRTLRIHDAKNRAVLVAAEHLRETVNALWAIFEGTVRLRILDGVVYLNDAQVRVGPGVFEAIAHLEEELHHRDLGGFVFSRPVDSETLNGFFFRFLRSGNSEEDLRDFRTSLLEMRDQAVEVLGAVQHTYPEETPELHIDKRAFAVQVYAKTIVAIKETVSGIREGREPDARLRITRIVQELVDISGERVNLLLRVAAIKRAEAYVYNHSANTCVLSIVLGRALGVERLALVDLGTAALFADLGFAFLPSELVESPEEFSSERRGQLVRAMRGQLRVLAGSRPTDDRVMRRLIVAYEHHLPFFDPVRGESAYTHVYSRIVQVADAFDALTTHRPWREAYSPDEALRILTQAAGTQFDPLVVRVLVNLLGMYPLGSAVRLGSGEIAIVYHNPVDPELFEKPWVKVLACADGRPVRGTIVRNLADHSGPEGEIERVLRPSELPELNADMALFV